MGLKQVWSRWKRYWKSLPEKDRQIAFSVASSFAFILIVSSYIAGHSAGYSQGIMVENQSALEDSFMDGRRSAFASLERGDPVVVFKKNNWLSRSIAISFPERNLSYACKFTRESEVQVGETAWVYDNQTKCRFARVDLAEKWDDPLYNNTVIGNEVKTLNGSESR